MRAASTQRRFEKVLAGDWGWWRTVTGNLAKLPHLAEEHPHLASTPAPYDALASAVLLFEIANTTPKSMKWKMRAKVGERTRWYELPEEV